jgi:hypothetical protein
MNIPELKEMTMDYLIDKVYFDVFLNFEYDNNDFFDIEFILKNSFFENIIRYPCQSSAYCDIPQQQLQNIIDADSFRIILDNSSDNFIYLSDGYICFRHYNYHVCCIETEMKITKQKAIPVLKKLIIMLNAVQMFKRV